MNSSPVGLSLSFSEALQLWVYLSSFHPESIPWILPPPLPDPPTPPHYIVRNLGSQVKINDLVGGGELFSERKYLYKRQPDRKCSSRAQVFSYCGIFGWHWREYVPYLKALVLSSYHSLKFKARPLTEAHVDIGSIYLEADFWHLGTVLVPRRGFR